MHHSLTSPTTSASNLFAPIPDAQRLSRMPALVMLDENLRLDDDLHLDEDFVRPGTGHRRPLSLLDMPAPSAARGELPVLLPAIPAPFEETAALDHLPPPRRSLPPTRREAPPLVPLQPESFLAGKDPWAVHSPVDLLLFFLPEISVATGLMTACGLMAGKLLARWTSGVQTWWVLVFYLGVLFLHLSTLYVGSKGNSCENVKSSLRTLVLSLFLLLLPHTVAFLCLTGIK